MQTPSRGSNPVRGLHSPRRWAAVGVWWATLAGLWLRLANAQMITFGSRKAIPLPGGPDPCNFTDSIVFTHIT